MNQTRTSTSKANSGLISRYKETLLLVQDYGPVNLSGIQFMMRENIIQAEFDLAEMSPELHQLNRELRTALDNVPAPEGMLLPPTDKVNRDPKVREIVGKMADLCFVTETMTRVGAHPLVSIVVAYMASLSGHVIRDPLFLTRWGEAAEKARATLRKLE